MRAAIQPTTACTGHNTQHATTTTDGKQKCQKPHQSATKHQTSITYPLTRQYHIKTTLPCHHTHLSGNRSSVSAKLGIQLCLPLVSCTRAASLIAAIAAAVASALGPGPRFPPPPAPTDPLDPPPPAVPCLLEKCEPSPAPPSPSSSLLTPAPSAASVLRLLYRNLPRA